MAGQAEGPIIEVQRIEAGLEHTVIKALFISLQ